MKSLFVTGADTGVGKTVFTCALAHALRLAGINVGVMKPFATGLPRAGQYKSEDVELLIKSSSVSDPQELVNPYFFEIPASPYMAAKKLEKAIDVDVVLSAFERLQSAHDVILVEGIGGIMTPILKDYFVADLIKDLHLDSILVTSTKIGSVNHTLLTLDACKKYGIRIAGLVISEVDSGYSVDDLESDLVSLSGVDVICKIPHVSGIGYASKILQQNNFVSKL
jgi:dethiobiotin synthetase